MTVYELIQELSQYRADLNVEFHFNADFDTDVTAEFDRDNEDDEHEVTVTAGFDDVVLFENIEDKEYQKNHPHIVINLEY